jgi:hypothetical protein
VTLITTNLVVQSGNHTMMGSEDDPKDGGAVAGAVFGAVFIYMVRSSRRAHSCDKRLHYVRDSSSSADSKPCYIIERAAEAR